MGSTPPKVQAYCFSVGTIRLTSMVSMAIPHTITAPEPAVPGANSDESHPWRDARGTRSRYRPVRYPTSHSRRANQTDSRLARAGSRYDGKHRTLLGGGTRAPATRAVDRDCAVRSRQPGPSAAPVAARHHPSVGCDRLCRARWRADPEAATAALLSHARCPGLQPGGHDLRRPGVRRGGPSPRPGDPAELAPALRLSRREQDVLRLVAEGYSNTMIAARLHLSDNTVRSYVESLLTHLNARNRAEAVAAASRLKLI